MAGIRSDPELKDRRNDHPGTDRLLDAVRQAAESMRFGHILIKV
mgnify:CR=1 FL=1